MAAVSPEVSYGALREAARAQQLDVFGAFHPGRDDNALPGTGTVFLFGPHEPGFWPAFATSSECRDTLPDPLDRWSKRVLGALARDAGAVAQFPSDGPPYPAFIRWALRSGRAWHSPVGLLVHDRAGLMVSYRGALSFSQRLDLPLPPARSPCQGCPQPCRTACPIGALSTEGYELEDCHSYLDTEGGENCLFSGCAVRRACPVAQSYGRLDEQSAFHMKAFHSR